MTFTDEEKAILLARARDASPEKAAAILHLLNHDDSWLLSPQATALRISGAGYDATGFSRQPHQRLVSDAIVDADNGTGPNHIIVSMPPRHGKSEIITRRTVAWYLGKYPDRKVGLAGYGKDFATDWGRKVRNDVEAHPELFKWTLRQDTQSASLWRTSAGGEVWTAGVNSGASGRGAHLLVMDDPVKDWLSANSPVLRERIWQEWQRVFEARVEWAHKGKPVTPIILVVMTRWHLDDLAGRLLGESLDPEGNTYGDPSLWREIRLPLLWTGTKPITYTFSNGETWTRQQGDALCPTLVSNDKAGLLKDKSDPDTWMCLYQQDPTESSTRVRVYFQYEKETHETELAFDPSLPLFWALDFNLNPMASVIGQCREQFAPGHVNRRIYDITLLDEIYEHGHVTDVVKIFAEKYRALYSGQTGVTAQSPRSGQVSPRNQWGRMMDADEMDTGILYPPQPIYLYGDAAGKAEVHAGPDLSAWATVKKLLTVQGIKFIDCVPSKDGPIKTRVNAVNEALRNAGGRVSMQHDPRCKHLKYDLENVSWQLDSRGISNGKLDSGKGGMLTHITDALGYMVVSKFGTGGIAGERADGSPR